MQHAGLQYGQGAANSHQSPPFAHADISQTNGGNTTSSLRQFRKKDGPDKSSTTDLNTSVENSHIARVPPHNHYPARPNDYYRYQQQYPEYNSPYKETPAQVKYSEIAETPHQPLQHVDHIPAALQKHKEVHKDFMDMCNISQQTHMKQTYPDNLTRQQSYPPDAASVHHHQYLHKEPQVHTGYKPESQYQQYAQLPKYNMPSQCRKYPPPPPPPGNDFLAKLERINPSMARSIMSDHHIRESQNTYPTMDQNRMYPQNQRYYPPTHLQNNLSYNYQPYNYPSSCNYKHPEYPRSNQMPGGAQYPALNPHTDRSISPRNIHMMNYGASSQKISPNYSQYNAPEYAQHYQHRRASIPQDYYQQTCRTNPYMGGHQISPEPNDSRTSSGGLRHFIENWAEEDGPAEIAPIFKDNIRIHNNETNNEQVIVINSSDIPQCLENVSLVPTENGQYIIKSGALDNSVVRIKETTENNGEKTVNLQIVEATPPKSDCMLDEENQKSTTEESPTVPYAENQKEKEDCDQPTKTQTVEEETEKSEETDESSAETSVIVSNEVSVIKDMPIIDEEHKNLEDKQQPPEEEKTKELPEETHITSTTKRTQRIFSVDDIINNIGSSPTQSRRSSLQFHPKVDEETSEKTPISEKEEDANMDEETEYRNAISVEDDSVILEIGGAWVQLHINHLNGTKVLSVLPLSESLVIDVNANCQADVEPIEEKNKESEEIEEKSELIEEICENNNTVEDSGENLQSDDHLEEINSSVYQSEVVIGEENLDNEVFLDLTSMETTDEEISIIPGEDPKESKEDDDEEQDSKTDEEVSKIDESIITEELKIDDKDKKSKTDEEKKSEIDEEEKAKIEEEKIKRRDAEEKAKIEEEKMKKRDEEEKARIEEEKIKKRDEEEKARMEEEKIKKRDEEEKARIEEEKIKKRDERRRSRENEERRKSAARKSRDNEERFKLKKEEPKPSKKRVSAEIKKEVNEEVKRKDTSPSKKHEKKVIPPNEEDSKKKDSQDVAIKSKKSEKKLSSQDEEDWSKLKKQKKLSTENKDEDSKKEREANEAKLNLAEKNEIQEVKPQEDLVKKSYLVAKVHQVHPVRHSAEDPMWSSPLSEEEVKKKTTPEAGPLGEVSKMKESVEASKIIATPLEVKKIDESTKLQETEMPPTKAAKKLYSDNVKKPTRYKPEEINMKRSMSKLEETVNKIKSLKEKSIKEENKMKKTSMRDIVEKKSPKIVKKVTFNLEAEIREINKEKEEIDRKKLSWEEYNSRKRKSSAANESEEARNRIMEDTVTSTGDISDEVVEQVELSIENAIKDSTLQKPSPKMAPSNWEDDSPSPPSPAKTETISTTNHKCIIDVNEFNIKPIESVSTPSPVSSSQFSYHSEDDSLQVYKDVVDSKLNSLNIKIPKVTKPKPVDRISVLLDRLVNKGSLSCEELEKVKKFIEIKRKMMEEEKKLTYEVRGERDYKDLKLHFRKVPEKRKKKRFRNLYAEDTSDSDSSRSDKGVGDYSVYQRDSQGVPKLIFKRKSGLPQPFVKLERSQAVELLAKKRKLY